MSAVHQHQ